MGKRSQYVFLAERNSVSHGFWDWPEGRGRGRELESRLHFAAHWLYTPPFLDVGVHLWNLETSYSSTHAQEKKKKPSRLPPVLQASGPSRGTCSFPTLQCGSEVSRIIMGKTSLSREFCDETVVSIVLFEQEGSV